MDSAEQQSDNPPCRKWNYRSRHSIPTQRTKDRNYDDEHMYDLTRLVAEFLQYDMDASMALHDRASIEDVIVRDINSEYDACTTQKNECIEL